MGCPARLGPNASAPAPGPGGWASLHPGHRHKENGGCAHLAGPWRLSVCAPPPNCSALKVRKERVKQGGGPGAHPTNCGPGLDIGGWPCVWGPPAGPLVPPLTHNGAGPGGVRGVVRVQWTWALAPRRPRALRPSAGATGPQAAGDGRSCPSSASPHLARSSRTDRSVEQG